MTTTTMIMGRKYRHKLSGQDMILFSGDIVADYISLMVPTVKWNGSVEEFRNEFEEIPSKKEEEFSEY